MEIPSCKLPEKNIVAARRDNSLLVDEVLSFKPEDSLVSYELPAQIKGDPERDLHDDRSASDRLEDGWDEIDARHVVFL